MRLSVALAALLLLSACADDTEQAARASAVPHVVGAVEAADDGALDAGFATFRDSLRGVVAARDTSALLAMVGQDARLSFGDTPGGPEGLRQMWLSGAPPPEAHGADLWTTMSQLLAGGSVDEDGAVTMPATAVLWPDTLDPFSHVAVTGTRVPARASASDSAVVALLSQIHLPISGPAADGYWPVRLPDGRSAAVATADAASPVGYRATFWDDGEGWRLRSFLRGD